MAPGPRRLLLVGCSLLLAMAVIAAIGLRHLHDDVRRVASRLLGCPADEIDVEVLDAADVERYRVSGCGGGGIMTCAPNDPVCFIVPEGP